MNIEKNSSLSDMTCGLKIKGTGRENKNNRTLKIIEADPEIQKSVVAELIRTRRDYYYPPVIVYRIK